MLMFDTLKYVRMLKKGGVLCPDVHSDALKVALTENIYVKQEVDMAITEELAASNRQFQAELDAFNKRTQEMKEESLRGAAERDVRYEKLRVEFKEEINQITNRGIGILGALIVIVGVISTFMHSFFH